jgi:hypothetical protein
VQGEPARIITAQIPRALLKRVHERAHAEDRSSASIVRWALTQYLEDGRDGRVSVSNTESER